MRVPDYKIYCPYCGEIIELLVDEYDQGQQYVEDCQVCCRPMTIRVDADDSSNIELAVGREDE